MSITSPRLFYRMMLALFVLSRGIAFFLFPNNYTDSDQTVMWQAAADMARLEFHHPFWYGQNYSSNLESMLAVPLIWLQIPVHTSVSLISSTMSALPVLLFAHLAGRRGQYSMATAVLLATLLFPTSFWQVTMLSRGFIQGTFCVAAGIYLLLTTRKPVRVVIAGFLAGAGLIQNPNSVFLLAAAVPLIAQYQKHISRPVGAITGAACAWLAWQAFYALASRHPEYTIHPDPSTDWSLSHILANLTNVDRLFSQVFLNTAGPAFTFVLFFFLLAYLARHNKALLFSLGLLLLVLTVSFGFSKLSDGDHNIFFSCARFFISLPYAMLLILAMTVQEKKQPQQPLGSMQVMSTGLLFIIGLAGQLLRADDPARFGSGYTPVYITSISDLRKDCSLIQQTAAQHRTVTILQGDHHMLETITCGCPQLVSNFPMAMRPKYERRQWAWQEQKNRKPGRILLLEGWMPADSINTKFRLTRLPLPGCGWLLQTDSLSNLQVMQRLFPGKQFN